jgi:hypothetical protein
VSAITVTAMITRTTMVMAVILAKNWHSVRLFTDVSSAERISGRENSGHQGGGIEDLERSSERGVTTG